ncbi:hypothetical protein D3C77_42630 [compost metagenome]
MRANLGERLTQLLNAHGAGNHIPLGHYQRRYRADIQASSKLQVAVEQGGCLILQAVVERLGGEASFSGNGHHGVRVADVATVHQVRRLQSVEQQPMGAVATQRMSGLAGPGGEQAVGVLETLLAHAFDVDAFYILGFGTGLPVAENGLFGLDHRAEALDHFVAARLQDEAAVLDIQIEFALQ